MQGSTLCSINADLSFAGKCRFLKCYHSQAYDGLLPIAQRFQDSIPGPLLDLKSKSVRKEATQVFTNVQCYMGDRPTKRDSVSHAQAIIQVFCAYFANETMIFDRLP